MVDLLVYTNHRMGDNMYYNRLVRLETVDKNEIAKRQNHVC